VELNSPARANKLAYVGNVKLSNEKALSNGFEAKYPLPNFPKTLLTFNLTEKEAKVNISHAIQAAPGLNFVAEVAGPNTGFDTNKTRVKGELKFQNPSLASTLSLTASPLKEGSQVIGLSAVFGLTSNLLAGAQAEHSLTRGLNNIGLVLRGVHRNTSLIGFANWSYEKKETTTGASLYHNLPALQFPTSVAVKGTYTLEKRDIRIAAGANVKTNNDTLTNAKFKFETGSAQDINVGLALTFALIPNTVSISPAIDIAANKNVKYGVKISLTN